MKKLNVKNINNPVHQVQFEIEKSDFDLKVIFEIKKNKSQGWNTNSKFSAIEFQKNHELWEYDVFEFFLQGRTGEKSLDKPYLEVQVSPVGQELALWIYEPRKISATPLTTQFSSEVDIKDNIWKGEIRIPLHNDFFAGKNFYAGVFSCLGQEREYFCHHQVEMDQIDFHRPDLFFKVETDE